MANRQKSKHLAEKALKEEQEDVNWFERISRVKLSDALKAIGHEGFFLFVASSIDADNERCHLDFFVGVYALDVHSDEVVYLRLLQFSAEE